MPRGGVGEIFSFAHTPGTESVPRKRSSMETFRFGKKKKRAVIFRRIFLWMEFCIIHRLASWKICLQINRSFLDGLSRKFFFRKKERKNTPSRLIAGKTSGKSGKISSNDARCNWVWWKKSEERNRKSFLCCSFVQLSRKNDVWLRHSSTSTLLLLVSPLLVDDQVSKWKNPSQNYSKRKFSTGLVNWKDWVEIILEKRPHLEISAVWKKKCPQVVACFGSFGRS